jgi:hypothetical protein
MVLPALLLSPVIELLVCCVLVCLTVLDLILLLDVLCICLVPKCFVPKLIKRTDTVLGHLYSMMLLAI